jgi:APA family basic amino acid/polyamine antiporter
VAVVFARYCGVLIPWVAEDHYLISPIPLSADYAISLSTTQFVAVALIAFLTCANLRGMNYGTGIQNVFTVAKILGLVALIGTGLLLGRNHIALGANFTDPWARNTPRPLGPSGPITSSFALLIAVALAQTGSLFSCGSWNCIVFTAGEVRNPRRNIPLSLAFGTLAVVVLYLLANLSYLVTLPLIAIQNAPADRVAYEALRYSISRFGTVAMAVLIMVSTFGCNNGLILATARTYYAMARDRLFFRRAARLNAAHVPGWAMMIQGIWSAVLLLPRTLDAKTGAYGNIYSNLLEYSMTASLAFYVVTVAGLFRLRKIRPNANRPYRVLGYPIIPSLYIGGAATVVLVLCWKRPITAWPGLFIVSSGIPLYFLWRYRAASMQDNSGQ